MKSWILTKLLRLSNGIVGWRSLNSMAKRSSSGLYSTRLLPRRIDDAPRDEDLVEDIRLSLEAGFNGARLHQKVFEERFLYHADRMGYLVWGEFGDWGAANLGRFPHHQSFSASYITEWLEAIERDYSHPSIVGWCPLNETWNPSWRRCPNSMTSQEACSSDQGYGSNSACAGHIRLFPSDS